MGRRPGPDEFGGNCSDFPEGETPKKFLAFVAGVEYCHDIWPEPVPKPPSSFELTQRPGFNCTWDWGEGRWSAVYTTSHLGKSNFNVTFDDVFFTFESEIAAVSFGFNNQIPACQLGLYYGTGGSAHLFAKAETTAPSLSKLCVLAGIPADIDTKMDVLPIDKDTGWVRFFRPDLKIKSHMKFTIADIF